MISIVYTGFNRFKEVSKTNHEMLFSEIRKLSEIQIYDFTKPNLTRPFCKYDKDDARGAIQVFDLLWALDNINGNLFIKLRTDIWFTKASIEVIIDELKLILDNQQQLSLIGWHYNNWDYNKKFGKMKVFEAGKDVQDYVIISSKENISPKEVIFNRLDSRGIDKLWSGNKVIRDIVLDPMKSFTVKTHIFLIRNNYSSINQINIALDFLKSFGGKGKAEFYTQWIKNHGIT